MLKNEHSVNTRWKFLKELGPRLPLVDRDEQKQYCHTW